MSFVVLLRTEEMEMEMEMVEMEMEMVRRRKIGNGNGFRFLEQKCILRAKTYCLFRFFDKNVQTR